MYDWLKLVQNKIYLNVTSLRLDNSGENKAFHHLILKSEFNIKFEFTAPGNPQQNGKVQGFATFFGKSKSMLNAARITILITEGL
jgi:hypothetical protein